MFVIIFIVTLILPIVWLSTVHICVYWNDAENEIKKNTHTTFNPNCRFDSFPGSFNKCFNLFCCILLDVPFFLSWFSLCICFFCVLFKLPVLLVCFLKWFLATIAIVVDSSAFGAHTKKCRNWNFCCESKNYGKRKRESI